MSLINDKADKWAGRIVDKVTLSTPVECCVAREAIRNAITEAMELRQKYKGLTAYQWWAEWQALGGTNPKIYKQPEPVPDVDQRYEGRTAEEWFKLHEVMRRDFERAVKDRRDIADLLNRSMLKVDCIEILKAVCQRPVRWVGRCSWCEFKVDCSDQDETGQQELIAHAKQCPERPVVELRVELERCQRELIRYKKLVEGEA